MKVLEKVSKVLSRNYGIKVEFKGSKAYTDYKKIVLPILPENIDKTDEAKIRGYCDHEIGHLLFSDPEVTQFAATFNTKVRNVRQVLEDFRIERDIANKYLGTKINMERTAQLLIGQNDCGDKNHIMTKLWVEGRRKINGYKFALPSYEDDLKAAFGGDIFDRMIAMGPGKENAKDALNLAIQMVKDYERKRQEQQEEPKQNLPEQQGPQQPSKNNDEEQEPSQSDDADGNGKDDEAGSDADESGADGLDNGSEEEANNHEDSVDSGDSNPSESNEDNKANSNVSSDGETSNSGEDTGQKLEHDDFEDDNPQNDDFEYDGSEYECSSAILQESELNDDLGDWENAMDSLQKKIERLSEKAFDNGVCLPYSRDYDQVKFVKGSENLSYFNGFKSELGSLATERSRISRIFLARQACSWSFDREEGKIDTRRLYSVKAGNRSVFKELHVSNDMDTAITMLCDCSGSMGVDGVKRVMTAVVFMLETLKTSSIKMEVLGYTTGTKIPDAPWIRSELLRWTRVERLVTYVFKEFAEPYNRKVKARISYAPYVAKNNNADADSLLVAYERIIKQPQRRKIIFVLSDGYPNSAGSNSKKNTQLVNTVRDLEKMGIEVVGIGMGVDVRKFYPKNICIGSTKQIVGTMHSELKRVLKAKI